MISLIAAVARNGVIGKDGKMPWHLPEDLKRFKQITMGGALVMGRKTWDSIGRPLPGRLSIVLTRQAGWSAEGAVVAHSIEEALSATENREVFVIGGAEIYKLAEPFADRMYMTAIHADFEGDTYFPIGASSSGRLPEWQEAMDEKWRRGSNFEYSFAVMDRVREVRLSRTELHALYEVASRRDESLLQLLGRESAVKNLLSKLRVRP